MGQRAEGQQDHEGRENHPIKTLKRTTSAKTVVYFALTNSVYAFAYFPDRLVQSLLDRVALGHCDLGSEHAWDALLSAFAARQGDTGIWTNDLHRLAHNEKETLISVNGLEAHYA